MTLELDPNRKHYNLSSSDFRCGFRCQPRADLNFLCSFCCFRFEPLVSSASRGSIESRGMNKNCVIPIVFVVQARSNYFHGKFN